MSNKKKVLIFSDSLLQDIGKIESESDFDFQVFAFPGLTAEKVLYAKSYNYYNVNNVAESAEDVELIVLCFGTNDIGHYMLGEHVSRTVLEIGQRLQNNLINAKLFYCMLHESNEEICRFNAILQESKQLTIPTLNQLKDNMYESDNLHINKLGLKFFIDQFTKIVKSEN